jgi:hypothetical protein
LTTADLRRRANHSHRSHAPVQYTRGVSAWLARIAAWSTSPARARAIYAVAALVGLATFLIVYGVGHLFGSNAYWRLAQPDERMALIGYRYFLHEPWHWPVFITDAVNVPYPKSVAFLDCIPIWALVNKAIATVVPPWESFSAHAYLGLWHGLAYALQPCFAVACLRALGHRTWRTGLVTALFFIAVPTWIFRYAHPALSAHWIELWALNLYLRTPAGQPLRRSLGVAMVCQLVFSSLVSPYHAVMSLLVFAASMLRSRTWRTIAVWVPLGIAGVGLANWFAGYFATEAMRAQWGFRYESANMLSWFVPPRSGIVGDARWLANVDGTPWQYEGYAYLGLGYLGLMVLLLAHARTLRAVLSRHRFLFVIAAAAWVFALSNDVYLGSHHILHYPVPSLLRWITIQFRSPGRFIWIPSYVVMVFLVHWAFTRFSTGRRFAIVVAACALQVVDATGDWALQRLETRDARPAMLDLAAWRPLVHAHRAVFILPTYSCVTEDDPPPFDRASMEIQFLASERAVPINGTYCAREMRKCAAEERAWATLELQPDTLYITLPKATAIAERFAAHGASCGVFEFGRACSTNHAAMAEAMRRSILRPPPPPTSLAPGQKLAIAELPTLGGAWTAPEAGGRWTTSSVSSVPLHLEGEPPPGVSLKLRLQARLCGTRQAQDVDVLLDETPLATLHLDASSNDPSIARSIAIPDPDRLRRPTIVLQFRPHDIRAAARIGCGDDTRTLGISLSQLWFE